MRTFSVVSCYEGMAMDWDTTSRKRPRDQWGWWWGCAGDGW